VNNMRSCAVNCGRFARWTPWACNRTHWTALA